MINVKTDGKAVTIHVTDCDNIVQLMGEIGLSVRGLVITALKRANGDEFAECFVSQMFCKIFTNCLNKVKDALTDEQKLAEELAALKDLDFKIDIGDINELIRQKKEMEGRGASDNKQ